ncbi:MAG TPA: DUF5666 domain-containing protein [Candidatus Angelobacter sp.]|nr:DUF5666 domain-containing protein [Candidatus Angelobacter sp.]
MVMVSKDKTTLRPHTNALFGAIIFIALACLLVTTGCASGNNNISTANTAGTVINFGDAPNDQIIAFELTINAVTLNGGSNPSVLPKPTEIELTHDLANFEPLSLATIPNGTYTGASLTVSNPEIVIVDPTTKAVTKLNAALSSSTVNVTFNPSVTIGSGASVINFDMDLASSVTINGANATVTPTFNVTTSTVPAGEAGEDEHNGEMDDLRGTITNLTSPQFTIQPSQTAQAITINTDANTQYEDGINSFSNLATGMIVSVDAATQPDGSILAKKVESETEDADGENAEGLITAVGCAVATACPSAANAATSITITTQQVSATSAANAPATATTVNVPITSSTQFKVHSNINGSFPAFDVTTIGLAQRVEVDSENESTDTNTSVNASKIKLLEQGFEGTVTSLSGSNFTLQLDATSAFASLTGQTTIAVQAGNARNEGVSLANNASVRIRGLLFFDGTSYTLIASRVAP